MKQNETFFVQKSSEKFHCECCDYSTCRKSQYNRHLITAKHKNRTNETIVTDLTQNSSEKFQCICGISFNNRTTLWRHKKKCSFENKECVDNPQLCDKLNTSLSLITPELVMELIKDNKEMKQIILEQNNTINNLVKNGITQANHNTNSQQQ